uniref:WRKY transcription factor 55-like n=1 Tax=Nicotiana tabacum TaxID=4097 RepID=A0A1S3ZPU3_TOBAC|nr:PREDICTED: WRKY transcription factor 55-like [Nicotiana tabacum]
MDETTATILYGCKLAKELEANLPNWANQPHLTLNKTEEIVAVFNNVKERLSYHHHHQQALEFFHAAEMLGERPATAAFAVHGLPLAQESDQVGVSDSSRGGGSSSSSSQRQRRRPGDTDTRTVRVAAPRMGNLELPPEDGYTWRKYGQKEILGSRFPRAYYRCTHQKLYNCPAKKQVQRLDNDPYVFEVTYRSQHTCYMSATAPTVPPPSVEEITHQTTTILPPPLPDFGHSTGGSLASICNVESRDGGAGPSGGRYGREVDYQLPVVDMADAMFNYSGSSSNNSMDIIFSSIDDKWDSAEKKE